jgi:hypothetical protein
MKSPLGVREREEFLYYAGVPSQFGVGFRIPWLVVPMRRAADTE